MLVDSNSRDLQISNNATFNYCVHVVMLRIAFTGHIQQQQQHMFRYVNNQAWSPYGIIQCSRLMELIFYPHLTCYWDSWKKLQRHNALLICNKKDKMNPNTLCSFSVVTEFAGQSHWNNMFLNLKSGSDWSYLCVTRSYSI